MPNQQEITEAPRVDLAGAKRLLDAGRAIFVDVRSEGDYEQAHVPGATSMPLREIPRRYGELPRGQQLIFY